VARFVENPDEATAAEYLATGRYLWNAGMFVAKAGVLMDALARFHPELAEPLRALAATWEAGREDGVAEYWEPLESAVIDTAVAEPLAEEGGVAVVPVEMGWSDVGDYASLADVVESNEQVAPRGSEQTVLAPPDALVYTGHKPVVVVGIPEAVVVDMDDVLFVTTRASSQDVKLAVEALGRSGLGRLA